MSKNSFYLLIGLIIANANNACNNDKIDEANSAILQSNDNKNHYRAGNFTFIGGIKDLRAQIVGTTVTLDIPVSGVVTSVGKKGIFWIQDREAGIFIYSPRRGDAPKLRNNPLVY